MQNIQSIHFYPIKGLQGFKLEESFLQEDKLLINDRKFAIAQSLNENNKISWLPKSHFKQLVNQPSLARVRLALLSQNPLTLKIEGFQEEFNLTRYASKKAFTKAIANLTSHLENTNLALIEAKNGGLSDTRHQWISVGTSASADKLISTFSLDKSYFRFRLNIWIETSTPFEELKWIGRRAKIGEAELEFQTPVGRCNAINVSAETGNVTTTHLPKEMRKTFGHSNLGVFARVVKSGKVSIDDEFLLQ